MIKYVLLHVNHIFTILAVTDCSCVLRYIVAHKTCFIIEWKLVALFKLPRDACVCSRQVFFNLFAAAEPSADVCVAHVTLCNDPSVCLTFRYKRILSQVFLACFGGTAGGHSRNPGLPRNPCWKTLSWTLRKALSELQVASSWCSKMKGKNSAFETVSEESLIRINQKLTVFIVL